MISRDLHRPVYHFLPPSGWMNDPNGPITASDGTHHLFYQHNPHGGWHEQMHWGHARTTDLVHWEHMPIALYPDQPFDKDGVYSGSAIELNNVPTLFYTGIRPEVQCVAIGTPDYSSWRKPPMPIVAERPERLNLDGFRDPTLWFDPDDGRLNMGIGSGVIGEGGCVLRYSIAADSRSEWRFDGFLLRHHEALLANCECPDYWHHRDGTWAMLASPQADNPRRGAGTVWFTGEHGDGEFHTKRQGLLDASPLYYAPKSFWHADGRRVVWGWLREARPVDKSVGREWAGVMSLPREIEIDGDGILTVRPSPEVDLLRGERILRLDGVEATDGVLDLAPVIDATPAMEHVIEVDPASTGMVSLTLFNDAEFRESIVVEFDFANQELSMMLEFDWESGTGKPEPRKTTCGANPDLPSGDGGVALNGGEKLRLRVFLDHSTIEVFANDRAAMSGRYYPKRGNLPRMCGPTYSPVVRSDERVRIASWEVRNLPSIW